MTTKTHKNRKDNKSNSRFSSVPENAIKYTTSEILCQLQEEREGCMLVGSDSFLADVDDWIQKISNYPETEFYLVFEQYDFIASVLIRHKNYIENTIYPNKRRGRALLPKELFRAKRISIYVSDEEFDKLEKSAKHNNMPISSFLREIGLNRKISQKPANLDLQAYSELSRSAANLNQIAKHLNAHPEAIIDLENIKNALNDFRRLLIGVRVEVCDEI